MASGSNVSVPAVPQFSGENYQIWIVKIKSYLKSLGLWDYVEQDKEIPPLRANPTIAQMKQHEEEKMKKDRAVTCLHSALADVVFTSIMHLETAKDIWDELQKMYAGDERVRSAKLLNLKRQFEMLKMKDTEAVKDYGSKLMELVNRMRLNGEVVEDHKVVEKMLVSLPEKFEAKISAIEESCDLKRLTISEMICKLQAQEQRISLRMNDVSETAFQAKQKEKLQTSFKDQREKGKVEDGSDDVAAKEKFPPCQICKRTNHLSKDCWYKGKPQIQCDFCKKWGHREKFCRIKQNQIRQQPAQQANFTDEKSDEEEHLFMASQACFSTSKNVWYVDSGCTSHMARDPSLFTSLDGTIKTKVRLGNGELVQSSGKGTISVSTKNGSKLIDDVLLIPDLHQNLLSVAQLLKKGYSLIFKDGGCTILDADECEIIKVKMAGNSFPIDWADLNQSAIVSKHDESELWHKRCRHFNMDAIKLLNSYDMVNGLPEVDHIDNVCHVCHLGKMHRSSFPVTKATRAKERLELVHTNLYGPMKTPFLNDNKYFLLFINDVTG